jgi:hypothetical protein
MPETMILLASFLMAGSARAAGCAEFTPLPPGLATEFLRDSQSTCADVNAKATAAKKQFADAVAADRGHCNELPSLAADVKKAEDTLKPALQGLRGFLRAAPRRYAKSSGSGVYQALWAQRKESCAALLEMMNAELVLRGRYSACNPAVGGSPYDGRRDYCFLPVDQGNYDPAAIASGADTSGTAELAAPVLEIWPNPDDTGGPVICAFAPGEEFRELCGPL